MVSYIQRAQAAVLARAAGWVLAMVVALAALGCGPERGTAIRSLRDYRTAQVRRLGIPTDLSLAVTRSLKYIPVGEVKSLPVRDQLLYVEVLAWLRDHSRLHSLRLVSRDLHSLTRDHLRAAWFAVCLEWTDLSNSASAAKKPFCTEKARAERALRWAAALRRSVTGRGGLQEPEGRDLVVQLQALAQYRAFSPALQRAIEATLLDLVLAPDATITPLRAIAVEALSSFDCRSALSAKVLTVLEVRRERWAEPVLVTALALIAKLEIGVGSAQLADALLRIHSEGSSRVKRSAAEVLWSIGIPHGLRGLMVALEAADRTESARLRPYLASLLGVERELPDSLDWWRARAREAMERQRKKRAGTK